VTRAEPPAGGRRLAADADVTGPLCWGQQWSWQQQEMAAAERSPTLLHRRLIPVPQGTSSDAVREAVTRSVTRHGVLRSTFDTDGSGAPRQRVWPMAASRWEFQEFGSVAEGEQWLDGDFDIASSWPLRTAVMRADGRAWVGAGVHHIAADLHGFTLLCGELRSFLRAGSAAPGPVHGEPCRQVLDIAAYEHTAAGQAASTRAIAYWRRHVSELHRVISALAVGAGQPTGAMYQVRTRSAPALERMAAMGGKQGSASVAVAAVAATLARFLGADRVAMMMLSTNRHLPGVRHCVCSIAQAGLCALDLAAARSFPEVVAITQSGLLRAQASAYYDLREMSQAMAEVETGPQGFPITPPSVNILPADVAAGLRDVDADEIFPEVGVSTVPRPCSGLNFHVRLLESAVVLELRVGTHLIPQAACRDLVSACMRLLHGQETASTGGEPWS
jgi:hypothetical protein